MGDKNFNERDDDWWWNDDEYPFAEGLYLKDYTNQPDFYKENRSADEVPSSSSSCN